MVVAAALPATVAAGLRHLESQRSLLALGKDSPGLSALLWIAYPKGGKTRGVTELPATPWWTKRDVVGEITGVTGYKPVAFVKIDDDWTALRFKEM